jgi:hypothetical protein
MSSVPKMPVRLMHYLQLGHDSEMLVLTQKLWEEAHDLIEIDEWSRIVSLETFEIQFEPYSRDSRAVLSLLCGSTEVCLLAVTLGESLERHARSYMMDRQPLEGYLLDRIGSFLVESAMQRLDREVSQRCLVEGKRTTIRFSPGYRDFSIGAQASFLRLIGDNLPGLYLTDSGLLKPEKTITALKGLETKEFSKRGQDAQRWHRYRFTHH